jgi:glycosyltransferase involved in cell wall biosynthesis
LSEGISVTLLEAMASGLPIAATDVGGNREVVTHEQTGLLSPRGDSDALAKNMLTLIHNPNLCKNMGAAGCRRVTEQFNQKIMHEHYARIYSKMGQARMKT